MWRLTGRKGRKKQPPMGAAWFALSALKKVVQQLFDCMRGCLRAAPLFHVTRDTLFEISSLRYDARGMPQAAGDSCDTTQIHLSIWGTIEA